MRGCHDTKLDKIYCILLASFAKLYMPGMMDKILNLELNDEPVKSLAARNDERHAWDSVT
jgi:hypothetical protein